MMKYFEWILPLQLEERKRLLKIYPDVSRAYEKDGIDGIDEFASVRYEPICTRRSSKKDLETDLKVFGRIVEIMNNWKTMHDVNTSIADLLESHAHRIDNEPKYRELFDSGQLRPIEFDTHNYNDLVQWVKVIRSRGDWNDLYLVFGNTRYEFNAKLSMMEIILEMHDRAIQINESISQLDSYDYESASNAIEFALSFKKQLLDASIGYFPTHDELHRYLITDQVGTVDGITVTDGKKWMFDKIEFMQEFLRRKEFMKKLKRNDPAWMSLPAIFNAMIKERPAELPPIAKDYESFRVSLDQTFPNKYKKQKR